jgi:hypothetical protein
MIDTRTIADIRERAEARPAAGTLHAPVAKPPRSAVTITEILPVAAV